MDTDIPTAISQLIDGWCERRALRPLGIILNHWPMPNGFTDECENLWAAMRHIRALCGEDLIHYGEIDIVNSIIGTLSGRLFPCQKSMNIEQYAEQLITTLFKDRSIPG